MGKHLCDKCKKVTGIFYGEGKRCCETFIIDYTVENGNVISCEEFDLDPFYIEDDHE